MMSAHFRSAKTRRLINFGSSKLILSGSRRWGVMVVLVSRMTYAGGYVKMMCSYTMCVVE